MEFIYYGSLLKAVAPTLSCDVDKELASPWIKKLFRPEYQTSKLKDKRNRYLFKLSLFANTNRFFLSYLVALTANLLNDEIDGIFQNKPPDKVLEDPKSLPIEQSTAAEWESDKMWQETLLALPDDFQMMECCVHSDKENCKTDHKLDRVQ